MGASFRGLHRSRFGAAHRRKPRRWPAAAVRIRSDGFRQALDIEDEGDTPVPEDRVARPGLAETPEALLPQGSDFADSAPKDKVDIATIEALYKSYAKSFPAPTHIGT